MKSDNEWMVQCCQDILLVDGVFDLSIFDNFGLGEGFHGKELFSSAFFYKVDSSKGASPKSPHDSEVCEAEFCV